MSNVKLSLTAISAALGLAIALQSAPVMAQSGSLAVSADALKGTQFADPEYVRYSWGLDYRPYGGPSVQYSWADINARLAQRNAAKVVAPSDARPVTADALKGSEFDSAEYVRHSWGLEKVSFDGPAVKLTWSEINARLANAVVKSKSAPQANAQPIPADALRGTEFDDPDYVRYSWGLERDSEDGPAFSLTWPEIRQRLNQTNVRSSSPATAG